MYDPYNLSVFFDWIFHNNEIKIGILIIIGTIILFLLIEGIMTNVPVQDTDWYKAFDDENDDDLES